MRHLLVSSAVFAVLSGMVAPGSTARADSFGGFSADETRYLSGPDTICTPLVITAGTAAGAELGAAPVCQRAEPGQVAALKFRRGTEQRGARAKYTATARGTAIELRAVGGTGVGAGTLATWKAMDPISRVTAVHLSPGEKLLAVEFQTRFAGRLRSDVIAFALPAAGAGAPDKAGAGTATQPAQGNKAGAPDRAGAGTATQPAQGNKGGELPAAARKALVQARKQSRRGRHRAAEAEYRKVLEADPGHAEARYGLARSLAGRGDLDAARAALERLAASGRDDAIVWLVEARFDKAFARLRGNPDFRRATELDRTPGAPRPLYERLLGFSNTWEQPEVKCENAQINLDMDRQAQRFVLRITTRCGGYTDETRLVGTFALSEPDRVILTMPNKKGPDDVIECAMQMCTGEDCLHCRIDQDLDFLVRPVRR